VFELLRDHAVTGLRIDHVDGLYRPSAYLHRWQEGARGARRSAVSRRREIRTRRGVAVRLAGGGNDRSEFSSAVGNLFVDSRNEHAIDDIYQRLSRNACHARISLPEEEVDHAGDDGERRERLAMSSIGSRNATGTTATSRSTV
jgi:maltooligosyltrehalose synthase